MIEYVKNYITDKLDEYTIEPSGTIFSGADALAEEICSYDKANGSILFDEEKSLEQICDWHFEAGTFFNNFIDEHIAIPENPFLRPGLYMVLLVEYGVRDVLRQLPSLKDRQDFKLDEALIQDIVRELEDVDEFTFNLLPL